MANGDGQDPGVFGLDAGRKMPIHEPGRVGVGATVGAVAGGLLGLIGGPAGLLAWTVGSAVVETIT